MISFPRCLLPVLLVLFFSVGYAQQEPISGLFWTTYSRFNPGATGIEGTYFAAANYRDQWSGIDDNPTTVSGLFAWDISAANSAVGINYTFDEFGFNSDHHLRLQYAYAFQFGQASEVEKLHRFRVGLAGDYAHKTLDFSSFITQDPNDPAIPDSTQSDAVFDLAAGFTYRFKGLVAGFAVSRLLQPTFGDDTWAFQRVRHYRLHATYEQPVSEELSLRPGLMVLSEEVSATMEASLVATWDKTFWVGGLYRLSDAVGFTGGITWKDRYRLGYLYEITTSSLSVSRTVNTHELTLSVAID